MFLETGADAGFAQFVHEVEKHATRVDGEPHAYQPLTGTLPGGLKPSLTINGYCQQA